VQSMDGESDGRGSGKIPGSPSITTPHAGRPEALLAFTSVRFLPLKRRYRPLLRQGDEERSNTSAYTPGHHDHRSTLIHAKAEMARHAGEVLQRRAAHDHDGTSTFS
jgi:hypothetical protein